MDRRFVPHVAHWSAWQRCRLVITDTSGSVVASYAVQPPGNKPGYRMLCQAGWIAYPGAEWEEDRDGEWSRSVYQDAWTHGSGRRNEPADDGTDREMTHGVVIITAADKEERYMTDTVIDGSYPALPVRDRENPHVPNDHDPRKESPLRLKVVCPVQCLRPMLATHPYGSLIRARQADFGPPLSVADVVTLCREELLWQIYGLGPRGIGAIQNCLADAGLLAASAVGTERKESP